MEDLSAEQQNRSAEKWLIGAVGGVRRELICAIGAAFGAGLLILLQARLLALACQRLVIDHADFNVVLPLVGWVAAIALGRGILVLLAERQAAAAAATVKQQVRQRLYRQILRLGPVGRSGEETGPLTEAVTAGVDGLEPYVARFLPHAAMAALLPPAVLLVVLPASWRAGLVLLFSAPFVPLFMVLIGRGSERLNRRQWQRLGWMAGHLLDLVQGLPDLRFCGALKREAAAVARVSGQYRHATMVVLRVAFLSAFSLEFFTTVGTAVVAVMIGFQLLHGTLSLLDGLFVLLLAPEFYLPLRTLGLSYHARMQGVAAAETIAPLLVLPLPDEPLGGEQVPLPDGAPAIHFAGVTYRYGGERGGVSDIDLELPAGRITALVGESGSGKTTLARLLVGLARPEAGRIMVHGLELSRYSSALWRSVIAWVPQQPFFFTGTLRANLLLGAPQASDNEIFAALELAAAGQFVAALPAGLDTELGDRGGGFSGGELRRLAVARAALRQAQVVVLDEPTAGLDPTSEALVSAAIRRLAINRTVLLISHREATVAGADQVVILSRGRIVQQLAPAEFLAQEVAWAH